MMLKFLLILFAFTPSSRSQSECGCQTGIFSRVACIGNPFASSQAECARQGCCWNPSFLAFGPRCYARDLTQCSSAPVVGNTPSCTLAVPRQQCRIQYSGLGRAVDKNACEAQGCCYVSDISPYCFTAARGVFVNPVYPTNPSQEVTTSWGQWSTCSQECLTGVRTRSRSCLLRGANECISRGINLAETMVCNQQLCQNWGPWSATSCSATCGTGFYTRSRSCWGFGSLGSSNCYSRRVQCNLPLCHTVTNPPQFSSWGQWKRWQPCNNPCGPGRRVRRRDCLSNGVVVGDFRCPLSTVNGVSSTQSQNCNLDLCDSWANWVPYTQCTETCGPRGTQFSSRACTSPSARQNTQTELYSRCSRREEPCILDRCPEGFVATERPSAPPTETLPPNVGGRGVIFTVSPVQNLVPTTMLPTAAPSSPRAFSIDWSAGQSTTTLAQIIVTSEWTTTDEFLRTTPIGGVSSVPEDLLTVSVPEDVTFSTEIPMSSSQSAEDVPAWKTWSTWSSCDVSCGIGSTLRVRTCEFSDGREAESNTLCGDGDAVQITQCNQAPCVTSTSESLSRSTTASTTLISPTTTVITDTTSSSTTTQQTTEPIPVPTSATTTEKLSTDDDIIIEERTAEWETWQPWGDCSSTCSPGLRIRMRNCKYVDNGEEADPTLCSAIDPGSMFDEGLCNRDLCERYDPWRTTECSVTCNRGPDEPPGIKLRRRRCVSDANNNRASEVCYLQADLCNATEPCELSTTTVATAPTTTTEITTTMTEITTSTSASTTTSSTTTTTESTTSFTSTDPPTISPRILSGDIWSEWGEWTACSSSCSPGIQNRVRGCLPNVPQDRCSEGGFMTRECNRQMCTGWSQWRTMLCDRTCGSLGTQLRRRICLSGQALETMPQSCYNITQPCEANPVCPDDEGNDEKLDILFLVDSTKHVDDCDKIQDESELSPPLRRPQLTDQLAPTYARIKKFITDFSDGWRGISNSQTRVGIQLMSGLCNARTRTSFFVEKSFNETHELLKEYISEMPYLCGDFWLDWAMQCSVSPMMTERYGDREDVPNVIVVVISNVPTASLPGDFLLRRVLTRLRGKSTVLAVAATPLEALGPLSRERYVDHTRKLACENGESCPAYLGSIWDLENSEVAGKIRNALAQSKGKA